MTEPADGSANDRLCFANGAVAEIPPVAITFDAVAAGCGPHNGADAAAPRPGAPIMAAERPVTIYVSHEREQLDLVAALVDLIEDAVALSERAVVCRGLPGYEGTVDQLVASRASASGLPVRPMVIALRASAAESPVYADLHAAAAAGLPTVLLGVPDVEQAAMRVSPDVSARPLSAPGLVEILEDAAYALRSRPRVSQRVQEGIAAVVAAGSRLGLAASEVSSAEADGIDVMLDTDVGATPVDTDDLELVVEPGDEGYEPADPGHVSGAASHSHSRPQAQWEAARGHFEPLTGQSVPPAGAELTADLAELGGASMPPPAWEEPQAPVEPQPPVAEAQFDPEASSVGTRSQAPPDVARSADTEPDGFEEPESPNGPSGGPSAAPSAARPDVTPVMAVDAGIDLGECVLAGVEADAMAPRLRPRFAPFLDALGGDFEQLARFASGAEEWVGAVDARLDGLAGGLARLGEWHVAGYQLAVLCHLAALPPEQAPEDLGEQTAGAWEAFCAACDGVGIPTAAITDFRAMLQSVTGVDGDTTARDWCIDHLRGHAGQPQPVGIDPGAEA